MESTKEFLLSKPITVARNGAAEECQCVTMVAPSKKLLKKSYVLQQYVTKAMIEAQQVFKSIVDGDEIKEEKTEISGKQVMQMLLASTVDMEAFFDRFEALAKAGAVTVNGKQLTNLQWDEIDDDDKEALSVDYVANFILALVMKHLSES